MFVLSQQMKIIIYRHTLSDQYGHSVSTHTCSNHVRVACLCHIAAADDIDVHALCPISLSSLQRLRAEVDSCSTGRFRSRVSQRHTDYNRLQHSHTAWHTGIPTSTHTHTHSTYRIQHKEAKDHVSFQIFTVCTVFDITLRSS